MRDQEIHAYLRRPEHIAMLHTIDDERQDEHNSITVALGVWGDPILNIKQCEELLIKESKPLVDSILSTQATTPDVGGLNGNNTRTIGMVAMTALSVAGAISANAAMSRRRFVSGAVTGVGAVVAADIALILNDWGNSYDRIFDKILIEETDQTLATQRGTMAHEYCHHVQGQCMGRLGFNTVDSAFIEGHARGVQRQAVLAYRKIGDERPLMRFYDKHSQEILTVLQSLDDLSSIDPHAVGHALFAIAELKHGPGIYAEALRNPRVVLG